MSGLWEAARFWNQYIALAALLCVMWRLTFMILDPDRRRDARARHIIVWFAHIAVSLLVSAAAASHYDAGTTPASWTAGARFLLNLSAIGLSLWWPHPTRLTHLEETAARRRP